MNYEDSEIAVTYNESRLIPENTMKMWMQRILSCVGDNDISNILDLGCGTGRFSEPLSKKFNAHVIGVDPSNKMIQKAQKTDNCVFKLGSAEAIPLPDRSIDLIFLSMVYHHIRNLDKFFNETMRVLQDRGFLIIRNSTADLLDQVKYLEYFPSALEINRRRLSSKKDIIDIALENGYSFSDHRVIRQIFADSLRQYADKIGKRGLSDLSMISDKDFKLGIDKMYSDKNIDNNESIIEPIDLFAFQKIL